jgi:hypothetical protein
VTPLTDSERAAEIATSPACSRVAADARISPGARERADPCRDVTPIPL